MRKKRLDLHVLLGGIMISVLLASVTPARARVYINIAPPPVQIEVPGTSPLYLYM